MAEPFTLDDLKEILVDRIGMDAGDVPDDLDTTFESVGLDSLAVMEVQLEVEQRYGFRVAEEDAENIKSFRNAVDYVNRELAKQS